MGTFLPPRSISALILTSASMESLTAALAAFWQIYVISAPEKPSVMLERKLRSMSLASGVLRRLALKMPNLDGMSGKGM